MYKATFDSFVLVAPTQAEIRLALTASEGKQGVKCGTTTWLMMGITLEDAQWVVGYIDVEEKLTVQQGQPTIRHTEDV